MSGADLHTQLQNAMKNISIAGVWLFSTVFPAHKRHFFMGQYISNPACSYQLPESFVTRLQRQEGSWDFVNVCPLSPI